MTDSPHFFLPSTSRREKQAKITNHLLLQVKARNNVQRYGRDESGPNEDINDTNNIGSICCDRIFDGAACECEHDKGNILPVDSVGTNLHVFG